MLLNANLDKTALKQEAIANKWRMMRGYMAGAFAIGGAVALGYSIDQAAKLQLAMTSVYSSVPNLSAAQREYLQGKVIEMSGVTSQTATTMAQEMATAARTGLGSFDRIKQLYPLLAKFADVQMYQARGRGQEFNPVDAVSYGVQFAHLFAGLQGAKSPYTISGMKSILEWINKLSLVQGESPMRALTQGKYFIPMGTALGLQESDLFPLMALMGQTGFLRGRGGSSLGRAFLGAISAQTLTGHARKAQQGALSELGILDAYGKSTVITKEGYLNMTKFNEVLAHAQETLKPDAFMRDLKAGFGVVATQFLAVLEQPGVKAQLDFIKKQMAGMKDIDDMFADYMSDFIPSWLLFVTNLVNLGMVVMLPLLPGMSRALHVMADTMRGWTKFLYDNPPAAWTAATVAIGVVAGSALYAATMLGIFNRAILATGLAAGASSGPTTLLGAMGKTLLGFGKLSVVLAGIAILLETIYQLAMHLHIILMPGGQQKRIQAKASMADYGKTTGGYAADSGIPYSVMFDRQFGAGAWEMMGWHAGHFIKSASGGTAFNALYGDQARLRDNKSLSAPVVAALTGGSSTSLADRVNNLHYVVQNSIENLGDRVVGALATLGINITIPNPDGGYKTLHHTVGKPGTPGYTGQRLVDPRKTGYVVSRLLNQQP